MNFQPSDYLNGLNLDFDEANYAQASDLDLFSKSDFLDVPELKYLNNSVAPVEPEPTTDAAIDKKRRNTAASARFRIKKKLKEQQMEVRAKDLQDKVYGLEKKLMQLEMENKCLKKLIMEKNTRKNDEILSSIKKRSLESKPFFEYTK